jgi:hypothetical protein
MRPVAAFLGLFVACVSMHMLAAERAWKEGVWLASDDRAVVVLEGERDVITAEPLAGQSISPAAGTQVKYAVEGSALYVLDTDQEERRLRIRATAPKYSTSYAALGGGHYIKAVAPDGSQVTLEDGSRWDIDARVQFSTAAWQPMEGIAIRRSTDEPAFSYEIDNTDRDDGALANHRVR